MIFFLAEDSGGRTRLVSMQIQITKQNIGYCPPGPCTCTSYGQANTPPPETGTQGYPLDGEDDSYLGLCSFDCNHVSDLRF